MVCSFTQTTADPFLLSKSYEIKQDKNRVLVTIYHESSMDWNYILRLSEE
jgi:hypothetical protein